MGGEGAGLVPTKNSISSNPGLGTSGRRERFGSTERRWFCFRNRERSSTVPVAIVGCFGERRFGLVGGVWQSGSGRLPFVPVMKPADLRDRHDATIARRGDRARDRDVLVQRQVSE
jgi:hypothetical protein